MRLVVAAVALALLAPLAAAGGIRVLDGEDLRPEEPFGLWTGKRPALADVDGDGDLDLVAQNGNGRVYVVELREGRLLAELVPSYPYGPDLGPFNGVQAADLEGDGAMEVVSVNRAALVSAWSLAPAEDGLAPRLLWERHLDDHHERPSADGGPALGDLDGVGPLEIVVQTEERGVFALRADGSLLWSLPEWGGNAEPVLADVDGDGGLDVVFFTDAGVAYAVDGAEGRVLWRFEAHRHGVWPGSAPSPGTLVELDGAAPREVVFCARNVEDATEAYAPGAPWYDEHHFVLLATREGKLVWKAKPEWGHPLCSAYVFAFDADGDARPEIFGMDWNTIGHKPGNWERLGDPHVFSFDADGHERWHRDVSAFNGKAPVAAGDWDGDGDQDIVAYGRASLEILDADTGDRLASVSLDPWRPIQGPLLADVDGDGALDAVVAAEGASDAILVVRGDAPFRAPAWAGWDLVAAGRPPPPPPPPPPPEETPLLPAAEAEAAPEPAPGTPPPARTPAPSVALWVAAIVVARLMRRQAYPP